MKSLHIDDLDDAVFAALEARAGAHRRSLMSEVKAILRDVAGEIPAATEAATPLVRRPLLLRTVSVGGSGTFSRDDIYDDDER